jgi:DNA repair exonuclease SbcCD ATPase subunit
MSKTKTLANGAESPLNVSITDSVDKVERIRDLIFGTHMRDYTQRFDAISRDLARLTQETTRLNELIQEQDGKFTRLLRQEVDRLGAQLQEQDKRAQQQLQQVDQRLTEQIKELDQKHTQSAKELATNLARTERILRDELHELSQQLNNMKVDRPTLGDLLINIGQNLKTNDPTPLALSVDLLDELSAELG